MTTSRAIVGIADPNCLSNNVEPTGLDRTSRYLSVKFGQATFNAEGTESPGRFFSRVISWPGSGMSGVTIGRGYDMGHRSQSQVTRELMRAGVPRADALNLAQGAGLRGESAQTYVKSNRAFSPLLTVEAQHRLFEEVTTPETIQDIRRIFTKPDTVATYGAVDWNTLPRAAQELVFDLRYRGDYTPVTRQRLQPILANEEWHKLPDLMNDSAYWSRLGVPLERIKERASIVSELELASQDEEEVE